MRKAIVSIMLAVTLADGANAWDFNIFGQENCDERTKSGNVKFAYDLNFEYNFDNREFDAGENLYTNSMTINAARLTPLLGVKVNDGKRLKHRMMFGIDILKNMGAAPTGSEDAALENARLFREILLFYNLKAKAGRTDIEGYAGLFPRRFYKGEYDNEFLSDSLKFFDNNVEGVLLQFRRPKSLYEMSCDWQGQYGSMRREKFVLAGYGRTEFAPWLSAGFTISYTHLANMLEYGGVVDNFLARPFVRFGFESFVRIQELSLKLSWLQGAQHDRIASDNFDLPHGGQVDVRLMNWNVGIENKAYIGTGLMPYYSNIDSGGNKYGTLLYRGDPFYRIFPSADKLNKIGFYDRLELFYQPKISDYLNLRLSVFCHFAENGEGNLAFAGSRQKFSLIFDLEELLKQKTAARKKRSGMIVLGKKNYM